MPAGASLIAQLAAKSQTRLSDQHFHFQCQPKWFNMIAPATPTKKHQLSVFSARCTHHSLGSQRSHTGTCIRRPLCSGRCEDGVGGHTGGSPHLILPRASLLKVLPINTVHRGPTLCPQGTLRRCSSTFLHQLRFSEEGPRPPPTNLPDCL